MMNQAIEPITTHFQTTDCWTIEGSYFAGNDPKLAIVVSAGTGFPRQFYHAVARHLASKGAAVLTYDYRGIGGSAGERAAFGTIEYPDWGRFDTTAAIDEISKRNPDLPICHLAHSVGGHFVGLVQNHSRVERHAFISVGTGYFGGHQLGNVPFELYFWWVLGTYSLWRHAAIERVGGWQGERLPPKLFKTWRKWSHRRAYFQPDLETLMAPHHYDSVTAPIASWIFADDPIATKSTARDLLSCYPNAPHELFFKAPEDYGVKRIGHEGAFRKGREGLWNEVWDWLLKS